MTFLSQVVIIQAFSPLGGGLIAVGMEIFPDQGPADKHDCAGNQIKEIPNQMSPANWLFFRLIHRSVAI